MISKEAISRWSILWSTFKQSFINHKSKANLYLFPQPVVVNQSATSWIEWAQRMYRFGLTQSQLIAPKRNKTHLPSTFSAIGVFVAINLAIFTVILPTLIWIYLFYGFILILESWRICQASSNKNLIFPVAGALALTHFCYGWGSLKGYLKRLYSSEK